jgi:hypothetical protein
LVIGLSLFALILLVGGTIVLVVLLRPETNPTWKIPPGRTYNNPPGTVTRSVPLLRPPAIELPTWHPDPALVADLDQPTRIQGYPIRPPKGFTHEQQQTEVGPLHRWKKDDLGNGRIAFLSAIVLVAPPNEPVPPVEDYLAGFFSGVKRHVKDWQEGARERGRIAEVTFTRVGWTCTDTNRNRPVQGFVYAAVHGRNLISLAGTEHMGQPSMLPLLETAARAFSLP